MLFSLCQPFLLALSIAFFFPTWSLLIAFGSFCQGSVPSIGRSHGGNFSFLPLIVRVIDLCWKVAHGVVYTAERLISFGMDVPAPCFCGHQLESLEHFFFSCPLAVSVWSWVQSLMYLVSPPCPHLLSRHVLFGFSSDELRVVPRLFVYLINVCKFFLWLSHNDFRFRNIRPSAVKVIESVKSRTRFYLPVFGAKFLLSRRRRLFTRQWGARGMFASFAGNQVIVTL